MTTPRLVAHRGYARRFPENTLEALSAALTAGACYIEFDIQMTADLVPVLLHDADLERTAGRPERLQDLTWSQLSSIDVGQRTVFGERFAGVRIPTLRSAVELLVGYPRAEAFVEVKPESIDRSGIESVLEHVLADIAVVRSRCIIVSSEVRFVRRARRLGETRIGLVLRQWSENARRELVDLAPEFVFLNRRRLPSESELWRGPWSWVIYEVVSPVEALNLGTRGVDLVETMAIGEMLADPVLGERGCGG